jgi:glycosyltransferase involved in cell wall biosynthesis
MRVLLTSEARFERTPDGTVWGGAAYGRALWTRYLDVFSAVVVVARVRDVRAPSSGLVEASAPAVQFCALPWYEGLSGLTYALPAVRGRLSRAFDEPIAAILRVPSSIAYLACRVASRAGRPFGAEIVGDPYQVFSPGAFRHPFRLPIRGLATAAQKSLARHSVAALYVTREALQRRYPTHGAAFIASDVALDDAAFQHRRRRQWGASGEFVLVTVGALDQPYKGTAVLLRAVRQLRRENVPVTLRVVGGGRLLERLQRESATLGVAQHVEFLGQQDRGGVQGALDAADLFLLPSLTEGLPRALLEAMARGLPAVATDVGGIPELLPGECLVAPRDVQALASAIARLAGDRHALERLGERNRSEARNYHEHAVAAARRRFLDCVKAASAGGALEVRCA